MDVLGITVIMSLLFTVMTIAWRGDPDKDDDVMVTGIISTITWMVSAVAGFSTISDAQLPVVWLFFGMGIIMAIYTFAHVMMMMKKGMEE